jgi:hypothetical protein
MATTQIFGSQILDATITSADLANAAVTPLKIDSTQIFSMAALRVADGTAGVPSLSFSSDTDTGMYLSAADTVSIAAGGSERVFISTGTTYTTNQFELRIPFTNRKIIDGNGFFLEINKQYGMRLSGSTVAINAAANDTLTVGIGSLTISPTSSPSTTFNNGGITLSGGQFKTADGTAGSPSHSFTNDTDMGLYRIGTDIIGIATNGTEAVRIDASQNVGIGGAPVTNGILTISSTTKAFVPPRMTTTQRNAITPLTAGMTIFNTDDNELNVYNGTIWVPVGSTAFPLLAPDGTAGAPSYSFTADTDIGMFRQGTNALSFATNAIEAIRIDATQAIDFLQHEAKQLVVHILASDPVTPVEGQIYYNSTTKQWAGWNGTLWVVLG